MISEEQGFEAKLQKAAELLAAGDVTRAEQVAVSALHQRPGNPLAQNLVGLAYFQQRRCDEALEVFDSLARRHADVVTLRANAGIAALLAGDRARAESHLRRAVDLDAGHRRAFAYLAVVHLLARQPDLARAALVEAGLGDLAERVGQAEHETLLLEARVAADSLQAGAGTSPSPEPWEGFAELPALVVEAGEVVDCCESGETLDGASCGQPEIPLARVFASREDSRDWLRRSGSAGERAALVAAEEETRVEQALDAAFDELERGTGAPAGGQGDASRQGAESVRHEEAQAPSSPAETDGARGRSPAATSGSGSDTTRRRLAALAPRPFRGLLAVAETPRTDHLEDVELHNAAEEDDRRCLVVGERALGGGLCVRRDLLVLASGELTASSVSRREKGALGGALHLGGHPVVQLRGAGSALLVTAREEGFEVLRLVNESCCLVQSMVAAFSAELHWENGRVPGTDVRAIELTGRGFVVVSCRAPLERLAVEVGQPVLVRGDLLVGWGGDVVPCGHRAAPLRAGHEADTITVDIECGGQGVLVVCLAGSARGE